MTPKLPVDDIRVQGYDWPRYALVAKHAVIEEGQVDLFTTLENLRSSRSFYRRQLHEAYAFKRNTGADYSDFTDRFDEYARMERELSAVFGGRNVDLRTPGDLSRYFRQSVLQEAEVQYAQG